MSGLAQASVRNRLLAALPAADFARLAPALEPIDLIAGQVVLRAEELVEAATFVETGTISMLARLEEGGMMEVGLIGRDGMTGLPLVFGTEVSLSEAVAQVPGCAFRIAAPAFQVALEQSPALRSLLLRYAHAVYAQVAQAAVCNGSHSIEQRLARWLLMAHDCVEDDDLALTQEFLAQMLGVNRPGVTITAGLLQSAGFIRYRRGRITILDRPGLESAACECYRAIRRLSARVLR